MPDDLQRQADEAVARLRNMGELSLEDARAILHHGTDAEVGALISHPGYPPPGLTYDESDDVLCERAGELPGDLRRDCCQLVAPDGRTCVVRPVGHEGPCLSLPMRRQAETTTKEET